MDEKYYFSTYLECTGIAKYICKKNYDILPRRPKRCQVIKKFQGKICEFCLE
jgi:hypothetical protein